MTSSYLQCFQTCVRFCCSVSSCSGVLLCACSIPTQPLALVTGRSLLPAPLIPRARLAWGRGLKQTFSGGVEKTEGNSVTKQESTSDAKSDATSMAASGMAHSSRPVHLRPEVLHPLLPVPILFLSPLFSRSQSCTVPCFSACRQVPNTCAVDSNFCRTPCRQHVLL